MAHHSISDTRVCGKEVLKCKGRLLARKAKASMVVSSSALASCLIVSGQEESFSDERKDCAEK